MFNFLIYFWVDIWSLSSKALIQILIVILFIIHEASIRRMVNGGSWINKILADSLNVVRVIVRYKLKIILVNYVDYLI